MSEPAPILHRWTRTEYDRMVETGVFHPEARREPLDLHDRRPEVYRGPNQGAYAERILLGVGETISPLAALGLRVVIDALLP